MSLKTGRVLIVPPTDQRYSEQREYKTYVFVSDDGTEKRDDLTTQGDARRYVSAPVKAVERSEQAFFQNLLTYGMENTISIPLWFSLSELDAAPIGAVLSCATEYREFREADDLIILSPDLTDWETATILSVGSGEITLTGAPAGSWTSGAWVIPLIEVIPQNTAQLEYNFSFSGFVQVDFIETDSVLDPETPAFGSLDTYLTYEGAAVPVWDAIPTNRISSTIRNPYELTGQPWQKFAAVISEATERILTFATLQKNAEERAAVRTFFDDRIGRLSPFWVRSRANDFEMAAAASATDSTITVLNTGEVYGLGAITRHVYIKDLDTYHEITNPTPNGDDIDLTVSPVLGGDLAAGAFVENLFFVRFNQDRLTVDSEGRSPGVSRTRVTVRELQRETP